MVVVGLACFQGRNPHHPLRDWARPFSMTRTKKFLAGMALVVVVGLLAYVYRDLFRPQKIQIFHRLSAGGSASALAKPTAQGPSVVFGLDRKYTLTSLKVVAVGELATNQHAHSLWHLVSDSNSIPISGFQYG